MEHHVKKFSVVAALALATACGSSPEDVCEHTIELAKNTAAAAVLDRDECIADMEKTKEGTNWVQWARFSSCVTDTSSVEQAADCSALLRR